MELISKTEDENDLLYLYSAVIRVVFNDRIEEEEIEQLDVAEVISTFKAVAEIVDASVNEKIRNISDILNGSQQVAPSTNTTGKMVISRNIPRKKYGKRTETPWIIFYRYVLRICETVIRTVWNRT